jgi:hypothetical protein
MSARQLTATERRRLIGILGILGILGRLGSDQPGEVANAARLAEKFRHQYGMIWEELLSLNDDPAPEPPLRPKPQPEPPKPPPSPPKPEAPRQRAQQPPDDATYSERVKFWEDHLAAKKAERRAAKSHRPSWRPIYDTAAFYVYTPAGICFLGLIIWSAVFGPVPHLPVPK